MLAEEVRKRCYVLLSAFYQEAYAVSIFLYVKYGHLVKMISARFPHGKVTVFLFKINKSFVWT